MALLRVIVGAPIGESLSMMVRPLGNFNLVLVIRAMMRLGNGKMVLEFLLVMLLVKR